MIIANGLDIGVIPTIAVPPRPPRIENPNNMGALPPDMVRDDAELYLWQGTMKQISL